MKFNIIKISGLILLIFFASCKNDKKNEKKLAGIWEAIDVEYIFYKDNKEIKDSVVNNSGALYLYDDDELQNQVRWSLKIVPNGFTSSWDGNEGRNYTLMGTNILKLTKKRLELSENQSDTNLNVMRTTIYRFKRQ